MSPSSLARSSARIVHRLLCTRHGIILLGMIVFCGVSFFIRLALLARSVELVSWNASIPASFFVGLLFDFGAAAFASLPFVVLLAILPSRFFEQLWVRAATGALVWAACYAMLFGGVSEWFFWEEFGTRLNFIAVDYLVYTHEVLGNIRESYPMPWILSVLAVAATVLYIGLSRTGLPNLWLKHAVEDQKSRNIRGAAWFCVLLGTGLALQQEMIPGFANSYNRELAKNGVWSLFAAFRDNQLDFDNFYPTMPEEAAFKRIRSRLLAQDHAAPLNEDPFDLLRLIPTPNTHAPEQRLNVIQITVESLSAEFLTRYGGREHITPFLDSLMEKALVFDRFYATGNRTDRGMEALTLSVPPTPGRSLVKRPDNEHMFSLGSVFRSKGYDTAFIYGGFGYFDNMNYFFGENGYRVIDRTKVSSSDITFSNVWGACDEDVLRWTLREADRTTSEGRPFHFFVMTTSNHRPYTFPEGRIDLPSKTSGRAGAVKYTDYAIGSFLREAAKRPWYNNTVFVIVADHCASSAGKTELPVERYHIPLVVFSPGGQIVPGRVTALSSQIDYAPTLLALLNWSYPSRFFGRNVLSSTGTQGQGRAFVANYQKLGYLEDNGLSILKPVRQSATVRTNGTRERDTDAIDDAIAYYQVASWLFKNRRQHELSASEMELTLRARAIEGTAVSASAAPQKRSGAVSLEP